jgi:hypothetical protein
MPAYRIELQGRIDPSWSEWLDRMAIEYGRDAAGSPMTILTGLVADQSALRGLLSKIWNLNLSLIRLLRIDDSNMEKQSAGGL